MLTSAHCTRAAVWTLVMGLSYPVFEARDQSWEVRDTLLILEELRWSLVVIVGANLSIRGMECYWTHNLAYS
jgi:hypothetical protein